MAYLYSIFIDVHGHITWEISIFVQWNHHRYSILLIEWKISYLFPFFASDCGLYRFKSPLSTGYGTVWVSGMLFRVRQGTVWCSFFKWSGFQISGVSSPKGMIPSLKKLGGNDFQNAFRMLLPHPQFRVEIPKGPAWRTWGNFRQQRHTSSSPKPQDSNVSWTVCRQNIMALLMVNLYEINDVNKESRTSEPQIARFEFIIQNYWTFFSREFNFEWHVSLLSTCPCQSWCWETYFVSLSSNTVVCANQASRFLWWCGSKALGCLEPQI